ncbi:hypothetical protein ACR30L_09655 [Psychromonas sp. PT13]|uniref:hypothetical protein n=1 Tax=Psychromonas sp. PT13 TaxID=3439547 RepID=UPI003EBF7A09
MQMIEVKLEQKANTKELLIYVTNKHKTDYFMDQMLLFKDGKYSLDCLMIYDAEGNKLYRRRTARLFASKFPEDYITLKPEQTYSTSIKLDDFFNINSNYIDVQYDASNSYPGIGMDKITSETLRMSF